MYSKQFRNYVMNPVTRHVVLSNQNPKNKPADAPPLAFCFVSADGLDFTRYSSFPIYYTSLQYTISPRTSDLTSLLPFPHPTATNPSRAPGILRRHLWGCDWLPSGSSLKALLLVAVPSLGRQNNRGSRLSARPRATVLPGMPGLVK